jgi:hypothetical protein
MNQFQPVTDPALLEQLNGGEAAPVVAPEPKPQPAWSKVTDPALLEQLNGPAPTGMQGVAPPSILDGKDAGIGALNVVGYASDDQEAVRYLASKLYPNEALDSAVKRFGEQDGVVYHKADDGKLYKALPAGDWTSIRGIGTKLAGAVGPAIPVVAGMAAGAATFPSAITGVGLPLSMGATAGAAAGGEYVRQKIGDYLMGDASTNDVNKTSVATEAGMAGFGQGIGMGVGSLITKNAVRDITRLDPSAARRAYQEAADQGINITPGEATNLPSLLAQQKRLGNIVSTSDDLQAFYDMRNGQIKAAWGNMLDNISGVADAEDVGRLARDTAQSVLEDTRAVLRAKAAPVYEAAYQKSVPMIPGLQNLLKRPMMKKAVEAASNLAKDEGLPFDPVAPDMRGWDYIKRGLDDIINSPASRNETTGGLNNAGRIANDLKRTILKGDAQSGIVGLDDLVPEYKTARGIYEEGVKDVSDAMQSALGIVAKSKDTAVLDAARHIFNPRTRSPNMIVRLRGAIEGKDPQAWQALKRLYIDDVATKALRVSESGEVLNPSGKLVKAFTEPRIMENLRAAMTPDEIDRMNKLIVVLRRAAKAPVSRSDTAWNQQMLKEEADRMRPLSQKFLRNLNPGRALRSLDEWRTGVKMDKMAKAAMGLITSGDPEAIYAMKELRRLSPLDKSWPMLFGHMVSRATGFGAGELIPDANYGPGQ